jgi:F-type H+-transporting ATPase subunit gamma
MAETIERVQARLQNISIVKPLLEALKTISLGSWQTALRFSRTSEEYRTRLEQIMLQVVPHLSTKIAFSPNGSHHPLRILVVIGSERGLCGNFNHTLAQHAAAYLTELEQHKENVEVHIYGTALGRACRHEFQGRWQFEQHTMPGVAPSKMAGELNNRWLEGYDLGKVDQVDILFNQSLRAGRYKTVRISHLPPKLPEMDIREPPWPDSILDTSARVLFLELLRQLLALDLYGVFLSSAIAEHSERYQLMEQATKNADDLIEELTQDVQAARRQAITNEMEELAVGAGLL